MAAQFDGINDSLRVPQVAGQGTTNYLTVAAWIYPTKRTDATWNRGTFISRYGLWQVACTSDGLIRWVFRNTNPGNVWHSTGHVVPLNQWTHIAAVYDNGVIRTYANGKLVDTFNGSGSISNANVLDIGGWPGTAEWFSGSLDEVRLLNRALTFEEIQALYTGPGPLLVLPLEQAWATDGANLPDSSGWGHGGTLHAGRAMLRTRRPPGRPAPMPSVSMEKMTTSRSRTSASSRPRPSRRGSASTRPARRGNGRVLQGGRKLRQLRLHARRGGTGPEVLHR